MATSSPKQIIIVGAGVGARNLVKAFSTITLNAEITVIQPNDFAEVPFYGPLTLAYPEHHERFVTGQAIEGVKTILGIASNVKDGVLTITSLEGKNISRDIPFDYIIAASGFSLPKLLVEPGQEYDERVKEINDFRHAATIGGDIVVSGGGVIALELASNLCEIVNHKLADDLNYDGKVILVSSSKALCPSYSKKYQHFAKQHLQALGCEIHLNDKVINHKEARVSSKERFSVELKSGVKLDNVAIYVPGYVGMPNTQYLKKMEGVLDIESKKVVLDEYLRSTKYQKLFALGGCAKLATTESYLGAPKIEAQALTIAKNIAADIAGETQLTVHEEGMPALSNAPVIFLGHHTYASFVPQYMPAPLACVCRMCGPPCNMVCCPCFGCAVLAGKIDAGICGQCCCPPEGHGVATGLLKFSLSGVGGRMMGFNGVGEPMPPLGERIVRS